MVPPFQNPPNFAIIRTPWIFFTGKGLLYPSGVVRHSTANITNHIKTFFCICSNMPFAGHVSFVMTFFKYSDHHLPAFLSFSAFFDASSASQMNLPVLSMCLLATQTAPLQEPMLYARKNLYLNPLGDPN